VGATTKDKITDLFKHQQTVHIDPLKAS